MIGKKKWRKNLTETTNLKPKNAGAVTANLTHAVTMF
jgi:hypothetical protein